MATIASSTEMHERGILMTFAWRNLQQNDDGDQVAFARLADRSVHVYGTFGGASLVIEGSNDTSNLCTLDDLKGNPISVTSNKIFGLLQIAAYVRPRVVGGDGTTSLNVLMLSRGVR